MTPAHAAAARNTKNAVASKPDPKKLFLIFISAVILALSFCRDNFGNLVWIGLVPLFFGLGGLNLRQAFRQCYLGGVVFYALLVYWLCHVTVIGAILLVLYLALYFALFGLLVFFRQNKKIENIFFLPAGWVVLEYARSFLSCGFGWGFLGYAQYKNLPFIQIADIFGVWGVSFVIVLVNVFIYKLITIIREKKKIKIGERVELAVALLIFALVYGYGKSALDRPAAVQPLTISVVQGNIPQEQKWDADFVGFILERYIQLTLSAAKERPQLIIWPETALPGYWEADADLTRLIKTLTQEIETPLFFGAATIDKDSYYNSAILLDKQAKEISRYNKLHLVPFGEYIPLENIFGFIRSWREIGTFSAGQDWTIFELEGKKFSVLICFEDVVPGLVREFANKGAEFFINITNDAWFKISPEPYQHLQSSVFRAVENRRPVVRCANTGISAFIDHYGRIISRVKQKNQDIFVTGYKMETISLPQDRITTLYSRLGDWFVFLCAIFMIPLARIPRATPMD